MKFSGIVIAILVLLGALLIAGDRWYLSTLEDQFKEIEKQRITVSNKLTTAKIVHENLNHVYELVTENMVFPGEPTDSVTPETKFFHFITQCVQDLKLELMSVKPVKPSVNGRITKYGYDIEVVGDFFKFGELCAKFENSRRIISVDKFDVNLDKQIDAAANGNKSIKVSMRVTTYLIRKETTNGME